jgi:hypothetical protein
VIPTFCPDFIGSSACPATATCEASIQRELQCAAFIVTAVAALAFATAANAAASGATGPYHLDSDGKCRAANGVLVMARLCAAPPLYPYCKQGESKQCGETCIPLSATCHTH